MKKILFTIAVLALMLIPVFSAHAESVGDTKQQWQKAEELRLEADAAYKQAVLNYQKDKTPENDRAVIDSAKTSLTAVLTASEAWLHWKNTEAQNNQYAPNEIKQNIANDVAKNLGKITSLKQEVSRITTRLDAVAAFLKMTGTHIELLTDVARNTGSVWVEMGNRLIATAESMEAKLRTAAEGMNDNSAALSALDKAKTELSKSKEHTNEATNAYKLVNLPGTPLIAFANGNKHLRLARLNLLTAQEYLLEAWRIVSSNN